jgi:acyl carrier protein
MTISSRTPDGIPQSCPICGKLSEVTPAYPGGDSCCPSCGQLLWWFRDRVGHYGGKIADQISLSTSYIKDLGIDSLDMVELIMEAEEEFVLTIPDEEAARMDSVADLIRYIEKNRRE